MAQLSLRWSFHGFRKNPAGTIRSGREPLRTHLRRKVSAHGTDPDGPIDPFGPRKWKLVSRDEIIDRLWGKGLYFDTDNSINTAIRKIRRL